MVYTNQLAYYEAIAASTKGGESGPFIDFMLNEILQTLSNNIKATAPDKVPNKVPNKVLNKVPNKVPNKSELGILRLLRENPRMTRAELAVNSGLTDNGIKKIIAKLKAEGWIERHGSNKSGYWTVLYRFRD